MSYTQQLEEILKSVLTESFLFDEFELQILVLYRSLPEEVQLLFFYLLSRTPDVRIGQIEGYTDRIPAWKDALDMLLETKLVTASHFESVNHGLDMLKKEELVHMAKKRRLHSNYKTNSNLRHLLLDYSCKQTEINFGHSKEPKKRMLDEINQIIGVIINIPMHIRRLFSKVSVIYSREQEIPDKPFLNSILTHLSSEHRRSFPNYTIQRLEGVIWSTKDEFCRYYKTLEWEVHCKKLETQKEWNDLADFCISKKEDWMEFLENYSGHVTGISWLNIYSSGHVLTRIMEIGANAYFKLKEYQIQAEILQSLLSQNMFLIEHKGRWYDELTKIADLYLSKNLAKQLCLDALCDENIIARRRLSILNRAKKLFKKQNIAFDRKLEDIKIESFPQSTLLANKVPGGTSGSKALYLDTVTSELLSVEQLALAHFKSKGWKGLHSENSILKTIFGLVFWDIIFMDMPGVFVSPYQNAPMDLGHPCFFEARSQEIESRLEAIKNGGAKSILETTYIKEKYKSCVGVDWSHYSCSDLLEILDCIGPGPLAYVSNKFAKFYKLYGGGIPDLCLWKPSCSEIKFVEVKGPGDRLSEKQILWMNDFLKLGINTELLIVKVLNEE